VYITSEMPNQRAKNKTLLGAFVDVEMKKQALRLAKASGISLSQLLIEALQEYVLKHGEPTGHLNSATGSDLEPNDEIWRL
jgi:hypothetical protein